MENSFVTFSIYVWQRQLDLIIDTRYSLASALRRLLSQPWKRFLLLKIDEA